MPIKCQNYDINSGLHGHIYPYMVNTGLNNASLVRILSIRFFCTFDTLYNWLVCSDFVDTDLSHNCASCPACAVPISLLIAPGLRTIQFLFSLPLYLVATRLRTIQYLFTFQNCARLFVPSMFGFFLSPLPGALINYSLERLHYVLCSNGHHNLCL
jgi:hypothetical protein